MMSLEKLLEGIDCHVLSGHMQVQPTGTCVDSRKAREGYLFFALKGQNTDGASFIRDAVSRGAIGVVTDSESVQDIMATLQVSDQFPVVSCANVRDLMGHINKKLYHDPSSHICTIGITGTNGKTTTAFLIGHILRHHGKKPGIISTIEYSFANRSIPAELTTPDNPEIFDLLSQMVKVNCDTAVMEVSSQAAHQKRISGIDFQLKVFTNLSQDHLDYHGTMDEYSNSKQSFLFNGKKTPVVLNMDDPLGEKLFDVHSSDMSVITYSIGRPADFQAVLDPLEWRQGCFVLKAHEQEWNVQTSLRGIFNVQNILAAVAAASLLGCEMKKIVEALKTFKPPQGRLTEILCRSGVRIFIDYAHTPDALRNVLQTLRDMQPAKVILCFGCGGNRDIEKRQQMGRVASEIADSLFLTNDNPRNEDPDKIISDIIQGIGSEIFCVEKDRRKAIRMAIESAGKDDIVLIAGKGHEHFQVIGSQYTPFNDQEVVTEILRSMKLL